MLKTAKRQIRRTAQQMLLAPRLRIGEVTAPFTLCFCMVWEGADSALPVSKRRGKEVKLWDGAEINGKTARCYLENT
jgi:hypothetical protein